MKILYASRSPLAGVCELMARCINEYFPEHEARVLNRGPGKHRWYCRAGVDFKRYRLSAKDQRDEALEWADLVHCMANVSARSMDRRDLLQKKVWVFQWHGAQIWPFERVWREPDYPFVRFIHIGQGWIERQPHFFRQFFDRWGAKVVPNVISADDALHRPLSWKDRRDQIGFAPSTTKVKAVNRKGIQETTHALRGGPERKSVWKLDLISHASFENCLRRKRVCRLGIDEIVTNLYHRSGLEFLSQGTPCICRFDEHTERALKEATGSRVMPFIFATPNDLRHVVRHYATKITDEERQEKGRLAREWIEVYYHPRILLQQHYLSIYNRG